MKNTLLSLLFVAFALCACNKENAATDINTQKSNICVEWKKVLPTDHSGHTINNVSIAIINGLFQRNNISNKNLRYVYYAGDTTQTAFPPYTKYDYKVVHVTEFTNGLEIFTSSILYLFRDNIINYTDGPHTKGTNLNTVPKYTIKQIGSMFLGHIQQFDFKGDEYKDSCFSAEFGYFNLNAGTNITQEKLIKAWKITLKGRIYPSEYPIAYYQDNDGKLIYYDNGMVSFH